jgi:hypothetical protein
MTDRAQVIIRTEADRRKVAEWAKKTGTGTIVEFRKATRSNTQNALLWARLGEIAAKVEWYGQWLSATDWKEIFSASLRKSHVVPGIDPGTFVVLGMRTSKMTVAEMTALLDLIDAFAAERGVQFKEHNDAPTYSQAGASKAGDGFPSSRPSPATHEMMKP